MRDRASLEDYRDRLDGERAAIPRILELFFKYGVHTTWATVGFLFCESKDELLSSLPAIKPVYENQALDPYPSLSTIGENEKLDPYHFAPSLVRQIRTCPGQEIGTHTFSHYYCLERGQDASHFRADLRAACAIAKRRGIDIHSIVFPRNQVNPEYLPICTELGITSYRGNQAPSFYAAADQSEMNQQWRRFMRMIDTYIPITCCSPQQSKQKQTPVNLCASQFLRPYSRRLRCLEPLRLNRITRGMTGAAAKRSSFHLWWHPHNFGRNLKENVAFLRDILDHFHTLESRFGMRSVSMDEAGEICLRGSRPFRTFGVCAISERDGSELA